MHYLDVGDNIFGSMDFCDRKVASLKKTLDGIEFHYAVPRVPVPQLSPRNYSKIVEWQIRATEFVARHHHRGAIPC